MTLYPPNFLKPWKKKQRPSKQWNLLLLDLQLFVFAIEDVSSIFKGNLGHFLAQARKIKRKHSEKISYIFSKKVFLISREMELSSPMIRKILKFSQIKSFLIFRQMELLKKLLIFREMELFSPRIEKILIFQEGTCKV